MRYCADPTASVALARLRFEPGKNVLPTEISVGAIQCYLPEDEGRTVVDLLEVDFFDDESLVIIYRSQDAGSEYYRCHLH